ncbi:E4 34K [Titi monkey adenovirus ECC-2011]|uniref:E4 34K n=1 Tax=titi monkey adenovirus 1 TaxID=3123084 RepID=G0ZAK0_9ADEN|nr:E4 34K [Titi monkey adenovirus ECC-2011]AEK98471.1 E4 34K [Titi monkey adenovirus ECC-2011]
MDQRNPQPPPGPLAPFHQHQLPLPDPDPPAQGECFARRCDTNTLHDVITVRSVPSSVMFTVYLEWPAPFHFFLSPYEQHLMRQYMHVCACPATLVIVHCRMIRGSEVWMLHCHCSRPGSLQCRAGAVLLRRWFYLLVVGSLVNLRIPWYRPWVNDHMPKEMMYVGSVYVRGLHLIYINVRYDEHAEHLIRTVNFGLSAFHYGVMNNMLVLVCSYCRTGEEIRFRCCARRTRRLLARSVRELDSISRHPLRASRTERQRQRMFDSVMWRSRALSYDVYDRCRNVRPYRPPSHRR